MPVHSLVWAEGPDGHAARAWDKVGGAEQALGQCARALVGCKMQLLGRSTVRVLVSVVTTFTSALVISPVVGPWSCHGAASWKEMWEADALQSRQQQENRDA